jgi:hypothetical protein
VDKPVFILEMPDLSDEAIVSIQDFLLDVIQAFESQYFHQLQRYYRNKEQSDDI